MVVEGELEAGRGAEEKVEIRTFPSFIHIRVGVILRCCAWVGGKWRGGGCKFDFRGVEKCLVCSFTLGWVLAYVDVRLREEEEGRVRKPEGGHKISGQQSSTLKFISLF